MCSDCVASYLYLIPLLLLHLENCLRNSFVQFLFAKEKVVKLGLCMKLSLT